MGETTIEWTRGDDGSPGKTWNPVRGCTRVSPGCGGPKHEGGCYAEKIAARFSDPGQPFHGFAKRTKHGGAWTGKLALIDDMLTLPLRWRKPRRIFVNSMSDLFHENLPDEAIDKVFAVMALCPQHTFQVLTKRSKRMRDYVSKLDAEPLIETVRRMAAAMPPYPWPKFEAINIPPPNVWLGVSAEDQARADERIPDLLATPAAKRFVSAEPLLGPVDLARWCRPRSKPNADGYGGNDGPGWTTDLTRLDWVITGGESGSNARPAHPDWFRSIRDQCADAGIAYFHKQNGEWAPGECATHAATRTEEVATYDEGPGWHFDKLTPRMSEETHRDDGPDVYRLGKKRAGARLDGKLHREFPR